MVHGGAPAVGLSARGTAADGPWFDCHDTVGVSTRSAGAVATTHLFCGGRLTVELSWADSDAVLICSAADT